MPNHFLPTSLIPILNVLNSEWVSLANLRAYVPGSLRIRLSVVAGNLRMHRILDQYVQPGDTVVDVGANIGYNTLYAAQRVGKHGQVYAMEPAQDNLRILYTNLLLNNLHNVTVLPYAAGSSRGKQQFYLRGDISAVNSLYQDNFYHPITRTVEVYMFPLDDLLTTAPALVKIDVEGGELEVLKGMSHLLQDHHMHLIIEWHPMLQQAAGYPPDALPRHLASLGYTIQIITHTSIQVLQLAHLPSITQRLLAKRSPVELLAYRA